MASLQNLNAIEDRSSGRDDLFGPSDDPRSADASGPANERTHLRVITGAEKIALLMEELVRSTSTDSVTPHLYIVTDKDGPRAPGSFVNAIKQEMNKHPRLIALYITEITADNLEDVRSIMHSGIRVRHVAGIKKKFLLSRTQYAVAYGYLEPPREVIWTNEPEHIKRSFEVFRTLWNVGVPADVKIREMEHTLEVGETRIIKGSKEIVKTILERLHESREQILILVASNKSLVFDRRIRQILLSKATTEANFAARLLVPKSAEEKIVRLFPMFQWKNVNQTDFEIHIYDRQKLVIIEYLPDNHMMQSSTRPTSSAKEIAKSAILMSNRQTILGVISVFERLWQQSYVEEKERFARRESQLLQDILTHDVRNYNQAARLAAELLAQELGENAQGQFLTSSLLNAIEGSTRLLEKAKKLGLILSNESLNLVPTDLLASIKHSISIVREANPDKKIVLLLEKPGSTNRLEIQNIGVDDNTESHGGANEKGELHSQRSDIRVLADELLDDIFVNLFSNSAKYAEGKDVLIEISIKMEQAQNNERIGVSAARNFQIRDVNDSSFRLHSSSLFWKILIADHGRGIPNDLKDRLFSRYLHGTKASGLGMSIVFGLVTRRYGGQIRVRDRVGHDYTTGTVIEVLLPSVD